MISYFEGRSDLDDILLTDPDLHLQKIFHQLWFGDGESIRVKIKVMVKVMVKGRTGQREALVKSGSTGRATKTVHQLEREDVG